MNTSLPGRVLIPAVLLLSFVSSAAAHVPYIEWRDLSAGRPFQLGDVEKSKAIYAYLDSETDVDVFQFDVTGPTDLLVEVIVPVCAQYAEFAPWFAVIGPGLPAPEIELPIAIPAGQGAVVMQHTVGDQRESFYEPFGGKRYYQGPRFEQEVSTPGTWTIIYWDPSGQKGDYVASIGEAEDFSDRGDILRSLINTIIIRLDLELHVDCRRESNVVRPRRRPRLR